MTEKLKGVKKRMFTGVFLAVAIGGAVFFMIRGCEGNVSPDVANLALKSDGKTYVYSQLSSTIVKKTITENQSPSAMAFVQIYKDGDKYFVAPNVMREVVDLFSGNYQKHVYKEKSYEGYVTSGTNEVFGISTSYESTDKIGEQLTVYSVRLGQVEKRAELIIRWSFNSKTGEYKALENCIVKSFWIQTNPSPGETVISSKDFLVVSIATLQEFYGDSFEYDAEGKVLYIVD